MKGRFFLMVLIVLMFSMIPVGYAAYHHEGEQDADKFLAVYPDKAGTKLDHCALCHSGGEVEQGGGMVSLGSCQWCHQTYGSDGSGNIIDTINTYGMDYLVHGRNSAAVTAINANDSDGDGYNNQSEIEANRYPGDASDYPSKAIATSRVYSRSDLEAMPAHTQFLLMNTSRSGDYYAEYTGVSVESLLADAGILDSATGITVYAPDGWSNYYPLEPLTGSELYHVNGLYPDSVFYYDLQADDAINLEDGWCDYSAPSVTGRNHLDPIVNTDGNRMILAYNREGLPLDSGILNDDNKLDGEGPYRLVPPQKVPSPPDQSSRADNQDVTWPYNYDWDHNAGASSRSATIIRVEPLPYGTTDIDILEAGWDYVDEEKVIIYGAIAPSPTEYNGWWYTSGQDGTGISIEIQNNTLFLAWYTFDQQGRAIWHTSDGPLVDGTSFSGQLYSWTGWPLGGAAGEATRTSVGTIQVTFNGPYEATLSWNVNGTSGSKTIIKFMQDKFPGQPDPRDIHGWWYDPSFEGMGFFLEARSNTLFLAWYNYRDDNSTRWWSCGGGFSPSSSGFSETLREYSGGQTIGGGYVAPTSTKGDDVSLSFSGATTATLMWNGTTYNLQRFRFGE